MRTRSQTQQRQTQADKLRNRSDDQRPRQQADVCDSRGDGQPSDADIPPRTACLAAVENRREIMFERPRRGQSTNVSEVSRLTLTIQSLNRLKPRLSGLQQHPYASSGHCGSNSFWITKFKDVRNIQASGQLLAGIL